MRPTSARCQAPDSPLPPLSVAPLDFNRFELTDVAGWRAALDAYGFVVLSGVLSSIEVSAATSLLWNHLEERTRGDRSNSNSWVYWPEESFRYGMIQGSGTHCDGVWFVRGLRGVRAAFANLFGGWSLHVSFDGFPAIRPAPAAGPSKRDWYHIDHALTRRGRWLAQGLVALTPSGGEDGGLVVWPCSHRCFPMGWGVRPASERGPASPMNDFEMLGAYPAAADAMPRDSAGLGPVKVCTRAGDLVLWDSRTVHCNAPLGPIPNAAAAVPALAELAAATDTDSPEGGKTAVSWSSLPALTNADAPDKAKECACAACRGDIATWPSAPLGRLGVYVCMQPAALTDTPLRMREAMVRQRAWTGHAPFRDVGGVARLFQDKHERELFKAPLPSLVAGCRVRRALAGLDWGVEDVEASECGGRKGGGDQFFIE